MRFEWEPDEDVYILSFLIHKQNGLKCSKKENTYIVAQMKYLPLQQKMNALKNTIWITIYHLGILFDKSEFIFSAKVCRNIKYRVYTFGWNLLVFPKKLNDTPYKKMLE